MKPKKQPEPPKLFTSRLEQIINMNHPLCVLAWSIDWKVFDNKLGVLYSEDRGAPAKPTRLMVGLNYLKHTYNVSDEEVVMRFLENPYWSRPPLREKKEGQNKLYSIHAPEVECISKGKNRTTVHSRWSSLLRPMSS